ncbi:MAG: allophanate hydrolase subunit 1 [Litoreibacter sp.]|uniref:5-oxoprolinase subunit B family protein n=1 Tax=Litoreibacter sp. TaxID=1969459 RepID=UPI0032986C6E
MSLPTFKPVAEQAVLVEFGTSISDDVNRLVVALDRSIIEASIDGVSEVVPALVNLLVIFDPLITDHTLVEAAIRDLLPVTPVSDAATKHHTLDICYDAEFAPDLDDVAKACGMSTDDVIAAHSSATFRVGMYGFAPGYAYLAGVPDAIQVPRKTTPLRDIPAGRVMIAGPQCLCTTLIMPTGWSIIGQTSAKIMTADPDKPFLFDVGDSVSFNRIRREDL